MKVTILQLNDSHAYFELHPELFWAGDHAEYRMAGGYARIASVFNRIRQEKEVLTFDCGDTIHGTFAAVKTRGEAMIPILNALDFNAMTAHWEFAYGPEQFKKIADKLQFPVLAVNCYNEKGNLVFKPYTIVEVNNVQVGVIGIAAYIVDKTMPPSFSKGLYFTLGNEELPSYIEVLRQEKVDLIVVISHLGFPQEMKVASEVEGIDVLLSAHTHNRLYKPAVVNNTVLIQSGCHGSFVGQLDVEVEPKRVNYHHELITVDEPVNPDPEIESHVDKAISSYRDMVNQVVGHTATALTRYTVLESTMDNLLLQALLDATGAEIAFSNGWRYGAPVLPGPVTLNDLYNIIPGNPPVSVVELTGSEIHMMLEENLEHTFAQNPYNQMGGYVKRCLGLNMYIKIENPYRHRIQELFIQGKHVNLQQVYTAAFVTTQGVPPKYGRNRRDLNVRAVEALQQYVAKGTVHAEIKGTVVAV